MKQDVADYPVPGRSPEMNRRIAAHEIGHAYLARAVGSNVAFVTIIPNGKFEGRCVRSGANTGSIDFQEAHFTMEDVVDVCQRIESLSPGIGAGRVENAETHIRAQTFCIELVGGRAAEMLLYPDDPPLPAEHDQIEARAFARIAGSGPRAVDALLAFAHEEATALLAAHLGVVNALVDTLVETGTLTGEQVDEVIMRAMVAEAVADERQRQSNWQRVLEGATRFEAVRALRR